MYPTFEKRERLTHAPRHFKDYVTRLSERTGRSWSKKLITLPDDLHERMVREAEKLNIPMYDAYGHAALLWLKSRGVTGEFAGTQLTGDEERFIEDILELYRNKNRHPEYRDAVDMVQGLIKLAKSSVKT